MPSNPNSEAAKSELIERFYFFSSIVYLWCFWEQCTQHGIGSGISFRVFLHCTLASVHYLPVGLFFFCLMRYQTWLF